MALKDKGKGKGKGDEDDDGESPFMSLEDVMRKLKAGPLNFGVYQTGDKDNPVLIAAHKRKNPAVLGKQAKKEAKTTKGAFGTLSLNSGELSFQCENDDPPASLKKKIKVMLRNSGYAKFKPRIVLPGGVELGDEGDDDDDDDDGDDDVGMINPDLELEDDEDEKEEDEGGKGGGGGSASDEAEKDEHEEQRAAFGIAIKELEGKIVDADIGNMAEKLLGGLKGGVDLAAKLDFTGAFKIIESIGGILEKILGGKKPEKPEKPEKPDKPDTSGKPDGKEDGLKKEIEAKWEECEPVLSTLIDAADAKISGQAAKLWKLMKQALEACDWKKAKGVLVVIEKFLENALEDIGDDDDDHDHHDHDHHDEHGNGGGGGGGGGGGAGGAGGSGTGTGTGTGTGKADSKSDAKGEGKADSKSDANSTSAGGSSNATGGTGTGGAGGTSNSAGGTGGASNVTVNVQGGSNTAGGGSSNASGGSANSSSNSNANANANAKGGAGGGGGKSNSGGGGDKDEAEKFKQQAIQISVTAQASATAANQAASTASASATAAAAAAAEAHAIVDECEGKVGKERGAECRKEADACKAASEAAAKAQAAVAASAKATSEASASASASANVTANQQGVTATQASADAAARSSSEATSQVSAATKAEADAKAALERCKAAKDKAITAAEKEKTDALAKSQAVIDKMKGKVSSAGTDPAALESLVSNLKTDLAEQQAIVQAATPNRGSIGEAQRSELEGHEDQCQQIVLEGTEAVTRAAQKMADEAKQQLDEKQAEFDKAKEEADRCKQEADDADAEYENMFGIGGKLVETMLGGLRTVVKTGIGVVSSHNAKAGEAITEGQQGVGKLFSAVGRAASGFLDLATKTSFANLIPQIGQTISALTQSATEVKSALGDFRDGAKAANQAVKDETTKLKQGVKEATAPFVALGKDAAKLVGPAAIAALDQARQGPTLMLTAVNPLVGMATNYGGSAFIAALQDMTKDHTEAQESCHGAVKAIEATKEKIKADHTSTADGIRTAAEAKVEEHRGFLGGIVDKLSQLSPLETAFDSIVEDIGKFADPLKPHKDALEALRGGIKTDAEATEGVFGKVSEALGGLGDLVESLFDKIEPNFGDNPVAPHEQEADYKVKAVGEKAKELTTKEKEGEGLIDEVKKAAADWLKGIQDEVKSVVDKGKEISSKAASGALENGMLAGIQASIDGLGQHNTKIEQNGGKVSDTAKKDVDKAKEELETQKEEVTEAIKQAKEQLKAELDAYAKKTAGLKAQRETVQKQKDAQIAQGEKIGADIQAKYGQGGYEEIEGAAKALNDSFEKADLAIKESQEAEEGGDAVVKELAALLDGEDDGGDLIKAKDKMAELIAKADRSSQAMKEVPGEMNSGFAAFQKAAAGVPAAFAEFQQTETSASKAAEASSASQLKSGTAAAKKGDVSALETFLATESDELGKRDKAIANCDNMGGTENARLRVVLATARAQMKNNYDLARAEIQKANEKKAEEQEET